jgi:hypothetical protein
MVNLNPVQFSRKSGILALELIQGKIDKEQYRKLLKGLTAWYHKSN